MHVSLSCYYIAISTPNSSQSSIPFTAISSRVLTLVLAVWINSTDIHGCNRFFVHIFGQNYDPMSRSFTITAWSFALCGIVNCRGLLTPHILFIPHLSSNCFDYSICLTAQKRRWNEFFVAIFMRLHTYTHYFNTKCKTKQTVNLNWQWQTIKFHMHLLHMHYMCSRRLYLLVNFSV